MIAADIKGELARMEAEHGPDATATEILVRMGVSPEEVVGVVGAVVDRSAQITRRDEVVLDAAAINWLDGFMVGWSLSRRKITLEEPNG